MAVRKTCRIVTSSRIGILLLFLMLTWVYAFMNYSMYRAQPGLLESDRIRQRILDDSENYVKALAREEKQGLNVQNSGVVYGELIFITLLSLKPNIDVLSKI